MQVQDLGSDDDDDTLGLDELANAIFKNTEEGAEREHAIDKIKDYDHRQYVRSKVAELKKDADDDGDGDTPVQESDSDEDDPLGEYSPRTRRALKNSIRQPR